MFTETGHGNGPMYGVGGAMKQSIDDVIAFHPNDIIHCTKQLLQYPPNPALVLQHTPEDVALVQASVPKKVNKKQVKKYMK